MALKKLLGMVLKENLICLVFFVFQKKTQFCFHRWSEPAEKNTTGLYYWYLDN